MLATSSPLSTLSSSIPPTTSFNEKAAPALHRSAAQLPFELRQHVQIYFEEQLFTQALSFLTSLVSSSASSFDPSNAVLIPVPSHLAIVATLAVHPTLTSRTTSKEKWEQAHAALRLIRLTNKVVGPVNARFSNAFSFTKYEHQSSRHGRRDVDRDEAELEVQRTIDTPYATSESLWTRAEDFWHVVGWAFNCSCLEGMYTTRWNYWSIWLETILDVLERDWRICYSNDQCEESLIGQYVGIVDVRAAPYRRVLRAVFADGNPKSLNEFREVFRNELKPPKSDAAKFKRRQVDVKVDEEIYGDYLVDHSNSSSEDEPSKTSTRPQRTRTPSSRRLTPRTSNSSLRTNQSVDDNHSLTCSTTLGSPRSLTLRLRLLHLLSHLAGAIPESFMDLDDLFTLFVEFIRPLPLGIFQQTLSGASAVWSPDAQSTLCEFLLQRMLESAAPIPKVRHDEKDGNKYRLTFNRLARAYAPWAASKGDVVSQAKVSLLVESLLRSLWIAGKLQGIGDLKDAVDKGVARRLDKVREYNDGGRKKKKQKSGDGVTPQEEEAWKWLVESGERMSTLVAGLN